MNRKQIAVCAVLAAFLVLDIYTIELYGFVGFFTTLLGNAVGVNTMIDLTIALVLILTWMAQDARQQGISVLPYVIVTLALGSAGPLLYLVRRFSDQRSESPVLGARALRN